MFRRLSVRIDRQALLAGIVGIACGTAAAVWSVGPRAVSRFVVQTSPTVASAAQTMSATVAAEIEAASATPVSAPVRVEADGQDVRQRARALAARPDVKALVALREGVVRLAEKRGETETGASKQLLDDLDRYLEGARALRLKLDAEEIRHARGPARVPVQ